MSVILGSGEHRYEVIDNWAKLPDGWSFKDVGAVRVRLADFSDNQSYFTL
jgi:hypothetical protein